MKTVALYKVKYMWDGHHYVTYFSTKYQSLVELQQSIFKYFRKLKQRPNRTPYSIDKIKYVGQCAK